MGEWGDWGMEVLNTSTVTLQENRFKHGFQSKRKQKKPTDVGISVQDFGNPFFVTDLHAVPRRHAALLCLLYRAVS
jgi:hypothetical protein